MIAKVPKSFLYENTTESNIGSLYLIRVDCSNSKHNCNTMIFRSIVPSEMSAQEKKRLTKKLQQAKQLSIPTVLVKLTNGLSYKVEITNIQDYE